MIVPDRLTIAYTSSQTLSIFLLLMNDICFFKVYPDNSLPILKFARYAISRISSFAARDNGYFCHSHSKEYLYLSSLRTCALVRIISPSLTPIPTTLLSSPSEANIWTVAYSSRPPSLQKNIPVMKSRIQRMKILEDFIVLYS